MKKPVKIIYLVLSAFFLFYLVIPAPDFPPQPPDTLKSDEPGDIEDPLRPSYFTDFDREGIIGYYKQHFSNSPLLNIPFLTYRLNYPPEESVTIIRDQARSTYLEELVHPFRESLFVNGFGARVAKDVIIIQDRLWQEKITIKYIPSSLVVRVAIGAISMGVLWIVINEWALVLNKFRKK